MQQVYVIGHRHPDTDSIGSVLGYAEFLNREEPGKYVPAYSGEINAETKYALATFGLEPPFPIESVEPAVADIPFFYTKSAPADMPTIDVAGMMDEFEVRNIPITDPQGRLVGLVSEHGLAKAYVTPDKRGEQLTIGPIPLETLARILTGEVLTQANEHLRGRVTIVIDALHVSLSRLTHEDVAIVGDNEPAQLALISAGIAALIVAEGAPVGTRALAAAKERGVSIITTPLDGFSVGRMVHLSLPAGRVVATDVPTVRLEEPLSYAKKLVTDSKYRTACVVDRDGKLLGMISRNTFLEEIQKQVILLDHNEYAQSVEGIEYAEILEVIDHHRLGAISTLKPVKFLNEPLGSTSTIIGFKFMESSKDPKKPTAGMLLAGILSDTLVMRMSTTTPKDEKVAAYLSEITGLDPVKFGTDLIRKGMDLENKPLEELLTQDTKRYLLFGRDIVIAQVMAASGSFAASHGSEIRKHLEQLRKGHGVDVYMVLFTDVIGNASDLFVAGDHTLLAGLGYEGQPVHLEGVMSRKKDFVPVFGQKLKNI